MRILLISDTHGRMDSLNELAKKTGAEYCFHLGDLCTYTAETLRKFPAEMLYKQLKHSPRCSKEELTACCHNPEKLRLLAKKYCTYGSFGEYLSGNKHFNIPVYAVFGNNDDAEMEKRLSDTPIPNLTFLNENTQVRLGNFLICGLGGGCDADTGNTMFKGCCFSSGQIEKLENFFNNAQDSCPRILLTHIPPEDNPELVRLAQSAKPSLILCGHTHHWKESMLNGLYPVLTLPASTTGYAILELTSQNWKYEKIQLNG